MSNEPRGPQLCRFSRGQFCARPGFGPALCTCCPSRPRLRIRYSTNGFLPSTNGHGEAFWSGRGHGEKKKQRVRSLFRISLVPAVSCLNRLVSVSLVYYLFFLLTWSCSCPHSQTAHIRRHVGAGRGQTQFLTLAWVSQVRGSSLYLPTLSFVRCPRLLAQRGRRDGGGVGKTGV